jgi:hypothetical protein
MAAKKTDQPKRDVMIAKEKIWVGGFLAHNVGDEVPAENVKANEWDDLVEAAPVAPPA